MSEFQQQCRRLNNKQTKKNLIIIIKFNNFINMIKGCKLNIHVNVIFKHDYFVIKLNFY